MTGQKALFLEAPINGEWYVGARPIRKPAPGELLVKIYATGLNPVDWMVRDYDIIVKDYPTVLGSEASGTVEEVGEGVKGFAIGDRVLLQGYFENDRKTFQQFMVFPAEITAKIPPNVSLDQAASVSLGLVTAAVGLYGDRPAGVQKYKPAWEDGGEGLYHGNPIVVFGGSTSVGQYVIQLAKLSGFSPIIATASPHNADLLKSVGATHVIDRKADVLAEAAKILGDRPVHFIYNIIADKDVQNQAWDLLAPGGAVVIFGPVQIDRGKYKDKTIIDTVFGSAYIPSGRQLGISLYNKLTSLLETGAIKPNRIEVVPNGLAGIPEGLDRLRQNKVSGVKLIARPQETP